MEHHLLDQLTEVARENVLQTYYSLAQSLPETEFEKREGYTRVRGSWPLSFCHFAGEFDSRRDPDVLARELKSESQTKDGLWVFVMPGDEPAGLRNALLDNGFSLRQCLCLMGNRSPGSNSLSIEAATDADSRMRIGNFMAEQFFPFSPSNSRSLVARSTALSVSDLVYSGSIFEPDAAMMLSRSKRAVGLYNLCVRKELRGNGLGNKFVGSALRLADQYGLPLTLQCHASLRDWYGSLGFQHIGTVHAFFSGGKGRSDIL